MRLKYVTLIAVRALTTSMVTGCETSSNADGEKNNTRNRPKEPLLRTIRLTYPEIPFTLINWMNGAPDRQPHGGVCSTQKSSIPAMSNKILNWDTKDMLLAQLRDPKLEKA